VELSGRGPIYENSKGDSGDTSHDGVHKLLGKIHSFQSGLYKFPVKSIVGFGHICLDTHITCLFSSLGKVVKNFIGNQSVVRNQSPRDKNTLVRADDVRKDCFDPICNSLGDNLDRNIAKGYGSKVIRSSGFVSLENEADMSRVKRFRVAILV
jgi:hypothetical protein